MRSLEKWLLFIIPFFFWLGINEWNLSYSKTNDKTIYGYVNTNPDTDFYAIQIKNWKKGNGFTLDPKNDPEMAVRRTPGYPIFYGVHYLLFGQEGSYFAIRYTQLFLYALSCLLLFLTIDTLSQDRQWARFGAWLYALISVTPIYCYYVITEGISSFLVILTMYLFSIYNKKGERKYLYLLGLVIAALFLSRPLMGVMLPAVFLAIVQYRQLLDKEYFKKIIVDGFIYGLGFATLTMPWIIRNYMVTGGDIVVAEKFYHGAPMNFGRGHIEFRTLNSAWVNTGSGVAEILGSKLKNNYAPKGDEEKAQKLIDEYIKQLPPAVLQTLDKSDINDLAWDMYHCYVNMHQYKEKHLNALRADYLNLPCHDEIKDKARLLIAEYKSANLFSYYIGVPTKTILQTLFQSNTHHIFSLNPKDGNFTLWQKLIKGGSLLFNISLFASFLLFLLVSKTPVNLKIIFTCSIVTVLLLLVWVVRHLENRYLIPFLPMTYITLGYWLSQLWSRLANRQKNS